MLALAPYILGPQDIIGAGDLDGLLSKHPTIERANFKLWLTSTNVIERVLTMQTCARLNLKSNVSEKSYLFSFKIGPFQRH
jgi:hypothetical protein